MLYLKIFFTMLFIIPGAALRGEIMPPEAEAADVIVLLEAETSRAFRGETTTVQAEEAADTIAEHARQFGATLQPQHPDTGDPDLSGYFVLAAPSPEHAERLIETLRDLNGIEAAYLKPQPAMP